MSEYISTIVDCDHSTGENANTSAPPRPPAKPMSAWRRVTSSPAQPSWASLSMESSMSLPDRQMSIAVQPAANAPATAEKSETAQAGVGWPM